MVDQVVSLRAKGVQAAILSSNKGIDVHLLAADKEIKEGGYSLLFSAPEAIVCDADAGRSTIMQSGGHNCN